MSKCDISIEFDSKDRIFRGGDTVTGTVHVVVNADVQCRAITMQAAWRTHGRGNRATGTYHGGNAFTGLLKKGEHHKFRFEFVIPHTPLTYRGSYLNVDHYVSARVDIPWAFDPKSEADFVVLPGSTKPVTVIDPTSSSTQSLPNNTLWLIVAAFLIVTGLILIPVFGFGLILLVIGAVVLFFGSRKMLAERKIGDVSVTYGEPITTPGRSVPIKVRFVPKSRGSINQVTAKFVGAEVCVSGSGSNRRTHRNELYKEQLVLEGPDTFSIAEAVEYVAEVTMPETLAYSFYARDNKVTWTIDIHIDIPRWPDWHSSYSLTVVPPEHLDEPPVRNVLIAHAVPEDEPPATLQPEVIQPDPSPMVTASTQVAEPYWEESGEIEIEPQRESDWVESGEAEDTSPSTTIANAGAVVASLDSSVEPVSSPNEYAVANNQPEPSEPPSPALLALHEEFGAAKRFSDEVRLLIEKYEGHEFDVAMTVDRVSTTIGSYDLPDYRNGKTVTGKLADSDSKVSIQFPESMNETLNELRSGDNWSARGTIVKWDELFQRLEFRNNAT